MKKNQLLVLIICAFLMTVGITAFIYGTWNIKEVQTFRIELTVDGSKVAGFKSDNDALYFGTIPPGGIGGREIRIHNKHDFPVFTEILVSGNVKELIKVKENLFTISPKETRKININAVVLNTTSQGNYTGKLTVKLKRN